MTAPRDRKKGRNASLNAPRRLAIATACATFCLLLIGGLVHNTRSSLACPDWPLCHGSAFPRMVGGVFYEHGHRLAAKTVAELTVALAILLALCERRLLRLGLAAVGLVGLQALLGALTVLFKLPPAVSTTHLAVSLLFFCYLIFLCFHLRDPAAPPRPSLPARLRLWIAVAAVAVYLQSLLGALMRHLGAGMACGVDLPLCRGALWPAGENLYVLLHATHRLVAVAVGLAVIAVAAAVLRCSGGHRRVAALALALPLVVLAQITIGILSVVTFLDALPVTAHLGGAALSLALLACLFLGTRSAPAEAPLPAATREVQPA